MGRIYCYYLCLENTDFTAKNSWTLKNRQPQAFQRVDNLIWCDFSVDNSVERIANRKK